LSPYFFPKFARLKGSDSKKTGVAWYRTPRQNAPGVPPPFLGAKCVPLNSPVLMINKLIRWHAARDAYRTAYSNCRPTTSS